MLQAYFDESERTGGTFCVAGYAFVPEQARKFIREWSVLFAATGGCRMVELLARQNRFKGSSETERDRLLREAVKIIKKRISFGVAVSCNVGRGMRITPTWIRGMGHAYPLCCHLSMMALGKKLIDSGSSERVTYVFEAGHEFEAEARDFVRSMAQRRRKLIGTAVTHSFLRPTRYRYRLPICWRGSGLSLKMKPWLWD